MKGSDIFLFLTPLPSINRYVIIYNIIHGEACQTIYLFFMGKGAMFHQEGVTAWAVIPCHIRRVSLSAWKRRSWKNNPWNVSHSALFWLRIFVSDDYCTPVRPNIFDGVLIWVFTASHFYFLEFSSLDWSTQKLITDGVLTMWYSGSFFSSF